MLPCQRVSRPPRQPPPCPGFGPSDEAVLVLAEKGKLLRPKNAPKGAAGRKAAAKSSVAKGKPKAAPSGEAPAGIAAAARKTPVKTAGVKKKPAAKKKAPGKPAARAQPRGEAAD